MPDQGMGRVLVIFIGLESVGEVRGIFEARLEAIDLVSQPEGFDLI
jgi:hypothetical protein